MKAQFPKNPWKDSEVEAHWDGVASIYVKENERVRETHEQRFTETIGYLQLKQGSQVLNISSRDGQANDFIMESCPECQVVNSEISSGLMQVAKELRPQINQVKINTYSQLPFQDGLFDRILTLETLEHVEDPIAFLKELYRVSSHNAIMALSCPPATSEFPYQVYTLLFGGHGEGPHRFPPSRRVKRMLLETGWNVVHHKGIILFPVGPWWFRNMGERIINRFQNSCISELGIRQIYVCEKQ